MKKILFSLFTLFTLTIINKASAQKGFSLSIKGTPQFSWLQNKGDNDNSNYSRNATFRAAFGVGAGYNFTNTIGLGLGVLYSLQGQKYDLNNTEYNQKVHYLKVPLMFAYNTNPAKKVAFVGKIGPQVSFLTDSKLEGKEGNEINGNTNDIYKNVTFGGVANAGAQFLLTRNLFLNAGVRFDYDFTNAENEDYSSYPAGRADTHNMTTGLEVGLKYQLK